MVPGLLPRHARRRDRRPVRPAQGDGVLRPRPRRVDLDVCRSSNSLWVLVVVSFLHRDPHAAVGAGEGRVGAALRARGEARHRELALAGRVLRHVPARRRSSSPRSRWSPAGSAASRRCSRSRTNTAILALWFDAITYVVSGGHRVRAADPAPAEARTDSKFEWTSTFPEIKDGLSFIRTDRFARAVIVGLGGGVIGAGAMVPLSQVFADRGARRASREFGVLLSALGHRRRGRGVRRCSRSRSGCRATRSSSGRSSARASASIGAARVQRRRPRRGDDRGGRRVRRRPRTSPGSR